MIKQTCACGKCKIETRQEDLKMFEEINKVIIDWRNSLMGKTIDTLSVTILLNKINEIKQKMEKKE